MNALALVVAAALAQAPTPTPPADAPLTPPVGWSVAKLAAGVPAPSEGCFLDAPSCISFTQSLRSCEAERAVMRDNWQPPWWLVGVAVVVGAGLGAVAVETLKK